MRLRPTSRRVLAAVGAAGVLAATFTAGAMTGTGSAPNRSAGVLDDAANQIAEHALHRVDRETLDAAAIQGMLRATGDEWGTWAAYPADPDGGYAGIGVWLRTDRAGRILLARVGDGSPATRAGLLAGDQVVAVDGRSTADLSAPVIAAALRGRPGTTVTVVVRRGATLRTVRLVRAEVPPPGVTVATDRSAGGPSVGWITVPAFTRGTGREVRSAVARLRGGSVAGVVLDLRGDPGGLLSEAVETASAFLDGGLVVSYTRRDGTTVRLDAVGRGDTTIPLVVLVDGGTASAAEVVAGALHDRDRAVLVGSRTFGKGSVQEPRTLADGSALELTVARYATPSGRSLEGSGLVPDIEVAPGLPPDVADRRAVDVLTGLVADTSPVTGGRG